jgi:hypothetical protein
VLDQRPGSTQALVVGGALGQVGEQAMQVGVGEADPAGLGVEAQQHLGHGQSDQLRVGQPRQAAQPPRSGQLIIDLDLECGQEGIQLVGRHNPMLDTLAAA